MLCLDLVGGAAAPPTLLAPAAGGVPVLEVPALDPPLLPSCLVGLLVGLLSAARLLLPPGVGEPVPAPSVLVLLWTAASCFLTPLTTLLGLGLAVVLGFAGSSTCLTPLGRRNMP